MVINDLVSNETAARAHSQQGHGNNRADPKAGYISATSVILAEISLAARSRSIHLGHKLSSQTMSKVTVQPPTAVIVGQYFGKACLVVLNSSTGVLLPNLLL